MRQNDLDYVLEIERSCFIDPWPLKWFQAAIRCREFCRGLFFDLDILTGYLIAVREDDSLHLANLAIANDYRRRGLAKALMRDFLEYAGRQGSDRIYLEVRQSNDSAIELYRSFGFEESGVIDDYYQGQENALVLTARL